jgi:hypothetical protein
MYWAHAALHECELLHTAAPICPVCRTEKIGLTLWWIDSFSLSPIRLDAPLPLLRELQPLMRQLFVSPLAFLMPAVRD